MDVPPTIAQQLATLPRLTVKDLRRRYAEAFGDETAARNKAWLVKRIAWKVQANAHGGLTDRGRERAAELAAGAELRATIPPAVRPWERQSDEPPAAFVRFLFYRNLGPARSLDRAYRKYCGDGAAAAKGYSGRAQAPGQWARDSARFRWVERAWEWDVWRVQTFGERAMLLFAHNLERALERLAEAIERNRFGDETWPRVLKTFSVVGRHIERASGNSGRASRDDGGVGRDRSRKNLMEER